MSRSKKAMLVPWLGLSVVIGATASYCVEEAASEYIPDWGGAAIF